MPAAQNLHGESKSVLSFNILGGNFLKPRAQTIVHSTCKFFSVTEEIAILIRAWNSQPSYVI